MIDLLVVFRCVLFLFLFFFFFFGVIKNIIVGSSQAVLQSAMTAMRTSKL